MDLYRKRGNDGLNLIVAVDENWAIGNQNKLLVSIPADQKFFREQTTGKVVVFGRKTLATFPNGQPLKNRKNIILSRQEGYGVKDATVVHSVEELQKVLEPYEKRDVFVIGGESVYRALLPYCGVAHVTRIHHAFAADTYFPNLEEDPEWQRTGESDEQTYFDLEYEFVRYERVKSGIK